MSKENNSLEQIAKQCEGHTPGPWGFFLEDFDEEYIIDVPSERSGEPEQPWAYTPIAKSVVERADAMLISHAPTLLRMAQEATAEVERLRARVAELEAKEVSGE